MDEDGRLYVCTNVGVEVFALSESGEDASSASASDIIDEDGAGRKRHLFRRLGAIRTPQPATNCILGGRNLSDLFITAGTTVWRIRLRCRKRPVELGVEPGAAVAGASLSKLVQFANTQAPPELATELDAMVRKLVCIVRQYHITRPQLESLMAWLVELERTGEWEDLLDVMGLTHAVDGETYEVVGVSATPGTLASPYRPGAPVRPDGHLCGDSEPGERLVLRGTVQDVQGKPLPGARLEFWGANHMGLYDFEIKGAPLWLLPRRSACPRT